MKRIAILGSTGSIGKNTLEVIREQNEQQNEQHENYFSVEALTTHSRIDLLEEQIHHFRPSKAVIYDYKSYQIFLERHSDHFLHNSQNPVPKNSSLENLNRGTTYSQILYGTDGLEEVLREESLDLVLNAFVGFAGLEPSLEVLKAGKDLALANKESLVVAGSTLMELARSKGLQILPVDSEHSALFFLLQGRKKEQVQKLILTASGGPFLERRLSELSKVTVSEALKHPTWIMGPKITVDSATLFNKGLELLEARELFGFELDQMEILIHKESIIHALVQTQEGELYAQLSSPDMRLPIQNALSYPEILKNSYSVLDLAEISQLSFARPDPKRFPMLALAYWAGRSRGVFPAVLNASNEIAVESFLKGRIPFTQIVSCVEESLSKAENSSSEPPSLEEIRQADAWARRQTESFLKTRAL